MKRQRWITLAAVSAIILVGFALRFYRLAAVPLRGDEAFSVQYWARLPLSQSLSTIATIEPHPLLTYLTFRAWGRLVGTSEFPMRALPALVNLLGIPALYGLGRRLGSQRIGLLAALFWAVHPLEIWHAQDARNYDIWAGVSAVALWLGYRAVQRDRRVDWILYAVGAAIAANIYYNELFNPAALGAFILVSRWGNWRLIRRAFFAQSFPFVTAGLSFVVLQWPLLTRGGYGGTASNFDASKLPDFVTTLTFGISLPTDPVAGLWPLVGVALAAGLLLLWHRHRQQAVFLGLTAFLPLLILSILSLKLKIFAPHYVLATVPAYILIVSAMIEGVRAARVSVGGKAASLAVAGLWLAGASFTLVNYYYNPAYIKAPNWPLATNYLGEYVKPDDLVIQLSIDPAFGYYYHAPALDIALPSFPAQTADEITTKLQEFTEGKRSVWLAGQPFPDWPNRDAVETWMAEHFQQVINTEAAGLHIQQFMPWTVREDELSPKPLAVFGDIAELVGSQAFKLPNHDLAVWLYWRARGQSDGPLKVFVHLEGTTNPTNGSPLWTQDDHFPQDGRIDTSTWILGAVYRDIYRLPLASVLPGQYDLRVGLYDPDGDRRVPVGGEDSYLLQSVGLS